MSTPAEGTVPAMRAERGGSPKEGAQPLARRLGRPGQHPAAVAGKSKTARGVPEG